MNTRVAATRPRGESHLGALFVETPRAQDSRPATSPLSPLEIRVLVTGAKPLAREGIARCLRARRIDVIAEASTTEELVGRALRLRPDVVLLDTDPVHLPMASARALLEADRRQHVVLMSGQTDPDSIHDLRSWGVHGLVATTTPPDDLVRVLTDAARGRRRLPDAPSTPRERRVLTRRETEVLQLAVQGHTNHEIASLLHISISTVKHHLGSLSRKLDARSRVDAVVIGLRSGLVGYGPARLTP
jgi:DNA-binding NarL/FixJ family response regulator